MAETKNARTTRPRDDHVTVVAAVVAVDVAAVVAVVVGETLEISFYHVMSDDDAEDQHLLMRVLVAMEIDDWNEECWCWSSWKRKKRRCCWRC